MLWILLKYLFNFLGYVYNVCVHCTLYIVSEAGQLDISSIWWCLQSTVIQRCECIQIGNLRIPLDISNVYLCLQSTVIVCCECIQVGNLRIPLVILTSDNVK